ncbi:hypothetical protein K432DRAFT_382878 [Lepidopterella palustris CBS 459.81]|uniref:Uncharacterized protein n=1 Tax=Lepidopterella palustris CBS 459.81 TaxID=1314670 RepID=A0A8E2E9F4_9PEZI|nr:hypothetical protein K432DRAFT_382878 [Lepidopterella palustris CBS 459.81]
MGGRLSNKRLCGGGRGRIVTTQRLGGTVDIVVESQSIYAGLWAITALRSELDEPNVVFKA